MTFSIGRPPPKGTWARYRWDRKMARWRRFERRAMRELFSMLPPLDCTYYDAETGNTITCTEPIRHDVETGWRMERP